MLNLKNNLDINFFPFQSFIFVEIIRFYIGWKKQREQTNNKFVIVINLLWCIIEGINHYFFSVDY
jgi:hypothetical protein